MSQDTELQKKMQEALDRGKALTRRNFFAASPAVGAGIGLLATAGGARAQQSTGNSSISSNFNGTPIPGGDWIWFNAVLNVHGLGSAPVTIGFMSSITFSVDGVLYIVPVPSALITFSPAVTVATTSFTGGMVVTTLPLSHLAGNQLLDGVAIQVPSPNGFPGGIQPVTWQGTFFSMTPGITVQWQWAAALYTFFNADYNQLGVKPVDDNQASLYQNSDHAGTPEFFKQFVTGGARGGGGSNFTGSYSGTAAVVPFLGTLMGGGGS
jgi:hypothetical protein